MTLRWRHLFLTAAFLLGGASTADAQQSLLGDVVADLHPDSVATLSIDGATTPLGVTFGEAIVQLIERDCTVGDGVRSCNGSLRRFMAGFTPFVVNTNAGQFTVDEPSVRLAAPIPVRDTGDGYKVPAGTLMIYSATISGTFSDGSTLTPQRIIQSAPLTSPATFFLSTTTQDLAVDGSFPFSIEDASGHAIGGTVHLMGSAQKPFVNLPPIADAGPDLVVACGEPGRLDGSASFDSENNITSYRWMVDGAVIATGAVAPTNLPLGTTTVFLEVRDEFGGAGLDAVNVTVQETAPVFTFVPPAVTASTCGAVNIGQAQASVCGSAVTVTNDAPTTFSLGQRLVTWTATSSAGLVTHATQQVAVFLGNDARCCPAGARVILGTSNNDTLTGTAGADCIIGLGGQDTLNGLAGNDMISGGEGDDVISGGVGNDFVSGGSGQDRLTGNDGNDFMSGGDGDDRVDGGNNDDTLFGGQGQDQLICGAGSDRAFGNDGDDRLEGGTGNDFLDGGPNRNTCSGGGGSDQFNLCTVN